MVLLLRERLPPYFEPGTGSVYFGPRTGLPPYFEPRTGPEEQKIAISSSPEVKKTGASSSPEEKKTAASTSDIHFIDVTTAEMTNMISKTTPRLLNAAAGKSTCCIFKVPPQTFIGDSYKPSVVSIGPYHRGEPHLKMIEEHKWQYLRSLLSRTEATGRTLTHYLSSIVLLEKDARECYSETIQLKSGEFLEMMVLDGCFILELFRKVNNSLPFERHDPLATMAWILPFFCRDFLRLENQIPFFILEKLFEISKIPGEESGPSLSLLAIRFFNRVLQRPQEVIDRRHNLEGYHLLDLIRRSFISSQKIPQQQDGTPTHIMHCFSKLRRSGIKLKQVKEESFLDVKFRNGVIEMPSLIIDEFMSSFLLNCVAFEQCHNHVSKHFTTYASFLDCLIKSADDVGYLCDHNIVENDFGTEAEVAHFINTLGKDVVLTIDQCSLNKLFDDVDRYYRNSWHVNWATLRHKYFNTPWSFMSLLAACLLLLLTIAQTFYAIYAYEHPNDGPPYTSPRPRPRSFN